MVRKCGPKGSRSKVRNSVRLCCFRKIKRQEIGRHPVGYKSCDVFKCYERNSELRMIREV